MTSTTSTPSPYRWQRFTTAQRLVRFVAYLGTVAVLVWAVRDLDIYWPWVWDAPVQIRDLFVRMSPPKLTGLVPIGQALIETVHIATLATVLSLLLALPTAYLAAQNTTPHPALLWLARLIVVSTRSVNTIIWALLFVAIFGPGVVAGILAIAFRSIGFVGKLMAEAIEEIDKRQVEAIEATGAGRGKVVLYGIVPQVLPAFFAVAILRWDINIRESTVLGLVGAGGIGLILQGAIDLFDWQTVATVLIAILGVVVLGEFVSAALRRRVL
ncbi:MAG TPA: phosphonate ABC transporter, permease protein PhnE [Trueperaceae bacterium]|jgi:phosphonate transport system permease protein|nr:phosphonate ABC transporter, permease protein PhnE [Trueperaceae bacterium]